MYIDEDSWQAALVDHCDGRERLWRVAEGHAQFYYNHQAPAYTLETLYDLIAGRYIALGHEERGKTQLDLRLRPKPPTTLPRPCAAGCADRLPRSLWGRACPGPLPQISANLSGSSTMFREWIGTYRRAFLNPPLTPVNLHGLIRLKAHGCPASALSTGYHRRHQESEP